MGNNGNGFFLIHREVKPDIISNSLPQVNEDIHASYEEKHKVNIKKN